MRARPTAIRSNSSRSMQPTSRSRPTLVEDSPLNAAMKSPDKPTEPTLIVVAPVSFFAQPAKFSPFSPSISGNSGSQKRSPYASADILAALDESTGLTAQASGTGRSAPTWASTHPNGADRVQRAEALAKATGKPELATTQDTAFLRMLDGLPYADGKDGRKVIRIVTVGGRDTIDSLSQRMAVADSKRERFIVINGLSGDEPLKPGTLVKLVVAA